MDLKDNEKRDLINLIENNQPLPEKYRFKLFKKKDEIELLWNGKSYDTTNVSLPFQIIEHVDEPREEKKVEIQGNLFDERGRQLKGWTNKLIWGNNSLVLSSLINGPLRKEIEDEGGLKLVYIDPPFNVGDDFQFEIEVGDEKLSKKRNALEQLAYSDTWGRGEDSFLSMLYERLKLIKNLISNDGLLLVHCDLRTSALIKIVLDEIFGETNHINSVCWKRTFAHGDTGQGAKHLGRIQDHIHIYSKSEQYNFNNLYVSYEKDYIEKVFKYKDNDGRRWQSVSLTAPGGASKGNAFYEFMGVKRYWQYSKENMQKLVNENKIYQSKEGTVPRRKFYLDESKGVPLQDIWNDIAPVQGASKENVFYPTQKPEKFLERIINLTTKDDDLIADFFCGSGTTLAVAEKLNRKWIGCDLGKFAIHTSRKRLINIQRNKKDLGKDYRAFEILNVGKYQREFFFKDYLYQKRSIKNEGSENHFYSIVLSAYKAKSVDNLNILKGVKNNRFVAIGPFNLQVTRMFVEKVIDECIQKKITKVDVLGFEFEMGLFPNIRDFAKTKNVDLNCLYIPNEVFDKNAIKQNQIIFYNTAYIDAEIVKKKKEFFVRLKGYSIFDSDNLFEETLSGMKNNEKREILLNSSIIKVQKDQKGKISKQVIKMKWKNWVDYWSVDFDFQSKQEILKDENNKEKWTGDYIFENEWQSFKTKEKKELEFQTPPRPLIEGKKIAVKVIDIFGNDTMKILEI